MASLRPVSVLRPVLLAAVAGLLLGRELTLAEAPPVTVHAAPRRWTPTETPIMYGGFRGQRWAHAAPLAEAPEPSGDARSLAQLGYADGVRDWQGATGVTVHERQAVRPGLNLACFGHAEAALLFDMDGAVLHRWSFDLAAELGPDQRLHHSHWRRVRLLPDGDLLAIYEGQYLLRLGVDSSLRWLSAGGAHHDLDVAPDGSLLVLTRQLSVLPRFDPVEPVLEDCLSVLAPDGTELRRLSLVDAFEASPWAALLEHAPRDGDPLHTNTLELLDGRWAERVPAFAAGRVLLSLREIDTVAVLDLERGAIVWAATGLWRAQHQPTLVDGGRLLVFDNKGGRAGHSRVLEFDPVTSRVPWSYEGSAEQPFFSAECGTAERLADGHTLITETDAGRAFEIDGAGRIVWEYRSPYRAGERGQYVSTLFELQRLPPDVGAGWADGASGASR